MEVSNKMAASYRKVKFCAGSRFFWFISGGFLCTSISLLVLNPGLNKLQENLNSQCDLEFDALCSEEMVKQKRSESKGSKLRRMKQSDLPPEMRPDWDPDAPEEPVKRLPQALILGYEKCGTGALVTFLNLHPDIVTLDWEVNYFCNQHYFQYGFEWYRRMMPPSYSHQVTIEKSPCYIMDPATFERMKAYNSSLKVIITVRDPLDLLMSKYGQMNDSYSVFGRATPPVEKLLLRKNGSLNTAFIDKYGVFSKKVGALFEVFPREQIHIVDGDGLIKKPLVELRRLETFLNIQHYFSEEDVYFDKQKGFYCYRYRDTGESKCLGLTKGRKHATLSPSLNATIRKYLRPYSEEFFEIVGKRFSWHL